MKQFFLMLLTLVVLALPNARATSGLEPLPLPDDGGAKIKIHVVWGFIFCNGPGMCKIEIEIETKVVTGPGPNGESYGDLDYNRETGQLSLVLDRVSISPEEYQRQFGTGSFDSPGDFVLSRDLTSKVGYTGGDYVVRKGKHPISEEGDKLVIRL